MPAKVGIRTCISASDHDTYCDDAGNVQVAPPSFPFLNSTFALPVLFAPKPEPEIVSIDPLPAFDVVGEMEEILAANVFSDLSLF